MAAVMRYGRRNVAQAFGQALRAIRNELGISQDKLSDLCDLDRTYPSLLERGLRGPTIAMLLRLADALDVEAARLLADTQAHLRGASPINDHLYRLASSQDQRCTPVGPVYSTLDEACSDVSCRRELSGQSGCRVLNVVVYEAVNCLELPVNRVEMTRRQK